VITADDAVWPHVFVASGGLVPLPLLGICIVIATMLGTAKAIRSRVTRSTAKNSRGRLVSRIDPLNLPLEPDLDTGFKLYGQYSGATGNVEFISCHVSVLVKGHCPHPPHRHPEEELLIMLAGEADLILPQRASSGSGERRLRSGQFVYYPAHFPHTLRAVSEQPANYLMFKWRGRWGIQTGKLAFGHFDTAKFFPSRDNSTGFQSELLFEKPTQWLGALHAHVTTLAPAAGYEPHIDEHDGAIVVLGGEVESLGRRLQPHGLLYFAAGEPHGMRNPGKEPAHYLVFEFHGRVPVWRKVTDLQSWKRKFKTILNLE